MKNIHILPTNKPSRLLYFGTSKELTLQSNPITFRVFERSTQNIYITNDEKIKEGDWMIRDNEQPIKVTKDFFWDFGVRYYKIILTTDPRLAPDVQKISDEFLEWFVKNPSCEEVEVEKAPYDGTKSIDKYWGGEYKIIIPKTTQQVIDEDFAGGLDMGQIIPKEETLEEAAEKYTIKTAHEYDSSTTSFIEGAKWQQEQIGKSEFLQRLRGTLSDAEARRLIFETFKKK